MSGMYMNQFISATNHSDDKMHNRQICIHFQQQQKFHSFPSHQRQKAELIKNIKFFILIQKYHKLSLKY